MTVNELIKKLRIYASDGHGDQEVTVRSATWDYDPVVDIEYVRDEHSRDERGVIQLESEYWQRKGHG